MSDGATIQAVIYKSMTMVPIKNAGTAMTHHKGTLMDMPNLGSAMAWRSPRCGCVATVARLAASPGVDRATWVSAIWSEPPALADGGLVAGIRCSDSPWLSTGDGDD